MERTDEALVLAFRDGEDEALQTLIRRYAIAVYNFVYRFGMTDAEAEDVSQETFVKVWRYMNTFEVSQSYKVWLFSIARNTTIDFLRKRKSIAVSAFDDEEGENVLLATLADPEPLPDEIAAAAHDAAYIEKIVMALPLLYREVLILRYKNNFSFEEIGNVIGRPLHTVKSQYRRALGILRAIIARDAPKKTA